MTEPSAPTDGANSLGGVIEALRGRAVALTAFGGLLIVLGALALAFSVGASVAAVTTNGVLFVLAGVAEITFGVRARSTGRSLYWIGGGLLYVGAGLVCVFIPMLALKALTLAFGAAMVAAGLVRFALIYRMPAARSRLPALFGAFVTSLLGAVVLANWPLDSAYVLGTLLGIDLLFHGAGWLALGMALRARL